MQAGSFRSVTRVLRAREPAGRLLDSLLRDSRNDCPGLALLENRSGSEWNATMRPAELAHDASCPALAVGTLRGAGVEVDGRRVARFVGSLCALALCVLAIALAVSGAEKNAAINELRHHGVRATIVVTRCLGLIGGSGSNLAGYQCSGVLALDGSTYVETIPGSGYLDPGTSLPALAVRGRPPLVSTVSALAGERASLKVFLAPAVIGAVLALAAAVLARRRGARRRDRQRPRAAAGGV